MKGKNLIMCGLCACIGFIGGEVRAYHKVLNELRTMERPKVTYMDYYDSPCLFHGGSYGQSQNHGPFCVSYSRTSNSNGNIGCRLQERPPKAA